MGQNPLLWCGAWKTWWMVDDGSGRLFEVAEAEPAVKAAAGAAKKFRSYDQGQSFLLPPSLDD